MGATAASPAPSEACRMGTHQVNPQRCSGVDPCVRGQGCTLLMGATHTSPRAGFVRGRAEPCLPRHPRVFLPDDLLSPGNAVLGVRWWVVPERTTKKSERQKHDFISSPQTKTPALPQDVEKIHSERA